MSGISGDGFVRLIACGDVNVRHRNSPSVVFDRVRQDFASADVRFANMEMCLYRDDAFIADKPGWYQSEPAAVDSLVDGGLDAVGCANNVTFGREAVLTSISVLDKAGISHCGSGKDLDAAREPMIIERKGVRFGFLARTAVFFPYGHAATAESAGVATIKCHTAYEPHPRVYELPGAPAMTRSWPDSEELDWLRSDVAATREKVDIVVTYFHWGVSGSEGVAEYQKLVAHAAIDSGSDVVLGSHAHVPQGIEVYKAKPIYYGLGNFAFDWKIMQRPERRAGLVADISIAGGEVVRAAFRPVLRTADEFNQPEILSASDPRGSEIVARMSNLCSALGTSTERQGASDVLVWAR